MSVLDFGCSPATCQLQEVCKSRPAGRCQLQRLVFLDASTTDEGQPEGEDWSDQDLAVLSLLLHECWLKGKKCEASKKSSPLKVSQMERIMKAAWRQCGVKLHDGQYVKRIKGRYTFDGNELLKVVCARMYVCMHSLLSPSHTHSLSLYTHTRMRTYAGCCEFPLQPKGAAAVQV